jgi:hypothetical protein
MSDSAIPHGPAECGLNQIRVDGFQLRSGRGSRTNNSTENRSKAGRWPSSSPQSMGAAGPQAATLKVGGGLGAEPPNGGLGAQPPALLDSYKHYRNSDQDPTPRRRGWYCGKWSMLGTSKTGEHRFTRHLCKSYRCSYCGPKKLRRLRWRLAELATRHSLHRMLTLTVDPSKLPRDADPITFIRSKVWRDMRVYIARHVPGKLAYIAILQRHESGVGHLHILVSRFLPQKQISRFSVALGGGQVVDVRSIEVRSVAAYLSKYLTKQQDLPPGVRHVTTSRGLTIWPEAHPKGIGEPPPVVWQLSRVPLNIFRARAVDARDEVYTEVDGAIELSSFVASGLSHYAGSPGASVC